MEAVVIGATGLVGSEIVNILLGDDRFSGLRLLTRRKSQLSHPKIQEIRVDFDQPSSFEKEVVGGVLFSALGTTLKDAGSKDAQYLVDHEYQYAVAKAAKANGVKRCVVVSSGGANVHSRLFYIRMKGEIEEDIKALGFDAAYFVRPGPLAGERTRPRMGEKVLVSLLNVLPKIQGFERLWPIRGRDVAKVCVQAACDSRKGVFIIDAKEIFKRLEN